MDVVSGHLRDSRPSPTPARRIPGPQIVTGMALAASAAIAVFVSPGGGATATGGLLVLALLLAYPTTLPSLVTAVVMGVWYYTAQYFTVRLLGFNWYPNDWLLVGGLSGLLLRAAVQRPLHWPVGIRPFWPAGVLGGVMACMAVRALLIGNSRADLFFDLRPFAYYTCAVLVPCFIRSREHVLRFVWTSVYIGIVGGVWGIIRSLTGPGFHIYGLNLQFARLVGPSEIVYPLALLSALGLLVFEGKRERRGVLVLAAFVHVMACFLTYSRGTYLALGVSFVAMLALVGLRSRQRMVHIAVVSGVSIGAMILVLQALGIPLQESFLERTKSITLANVDLSIAQRLLEWNNAYSAFRAQPIFGAGLGHLFHFYLPPYGWYTYNYCHNSYLYVLAKTGIVGFLTFAFFLAAWGTTTLRAYLRAGSEEMRGAMLGWAGCFIYLLVKSTTTWMLNIDFWALYFAFVIGATAMIATRPAPDAIRRP